MEKHETKTEGHEPVTASHKNPGERKEAISRLSKDEFNNLQRYVDRLLYSGYEFTDLYIVLAGYGRKKEGGKESFGFRYITLAGTLVQDDRGIRLMDEFDVYEYSKKEATLVLKNVTVENIDQHLENLK
jgi:hypothetical protein